MADERLWGRRGNTTAATAAIACHHNLNLALRLRGFHLRRQWSCAFCFWRQGTIHVEMGARTGFFAASWIEPVDWRNDFGRSHCGRYLQRGRYGCGFRIAGGASQRLISDHDRRRCTPVDHVRGSSEWKSRCGLWAVDNPISELYLESGPGMASGLHSLFKAPVLLVASSLQRSNECQALPSHAGGFSGLHLYSGRRRSALSVDGFRPACGTDVGWEQR